MADLTGKIVLITGAAGAVGGAVAAAVKAGRRHRRSPATSRPAAASMLALDVTERGRLAARRRRDRARPRPARRAGQRRRHRRARQRRAARLRRLAARARRQSRRHFPRLQIRLSAAAQDKAARSSICRRCSGLVGGHNLAAYNASKGGVSLLSKSVALAGARCKPPVRCNAVCPAFLEGPMVDFTVAARRAIRRRRMQKMAAAIPLQRLGKPAEVAALCVYLLSDEAAFHHRRRSADRRRADGASVEVAAAHQRGDVRGDRARQALQVVAAFQHRDDAALRALRRRSPSASASPRCNPLPPD